MARRKNHHPRNSECASSVRSASAASASSSKVSSNVNSPSNNSNNTANNNRTCAVSNENKTNIRRSNGIRVPSEAEEEEGREEEEESGEDEVAEDEGDGDEDDGDDEAGRREDDVKSNNSYSSNQNLRRKSVKRKRRKRLGRPPQNLSMEESNSANGSVGSTTRQLTNGCQQSFQCPSCKKEVDSASEFTRHIRQHNTVESAASSTHCCSLCNKVLSSASSLDRHMLVHSGERPFKCSRCDMAFTTNGNMHRHMRTHHDGGYKSSSPSLNNSVHNNSNISEDEYNNNTTKKSRGTAVKRKLHVPKSNTNEVTGGRNLWPKRSRGLAEDDEEAMDEEGEEGEEKDGDEEMHAENCADDATLQCPLCCEDFLCKSGLKRHLDGHSAEDFKCADCDELFDDWKTLLKHLHTVHLKSLEEPTVILGANGETTILNINNNNVKAADTGFHDLTFVDFSTSKFALIAKSACEKHVRRPSSAYHSFQCHHCWKAFPCGSSLKMHMKTTHVLGNSTRKSTPPPNGTTTCVKCQADFPTHHHLETHSLRHQATEHCVTPYSNLSSEEGRQAKKMRPRVVTGDAAPDMDVNLDKKSFLALLELQSKNEAEVAPEDGELAAKNQVKKNNQLNGRCGSNNKTPRVIDTHSNDFADIQSIIDVTSSSTMNIIPSILKMGSSPATTRPSSTPSADLPASPRLADSVTASPELPSANQNQTPVADGPVEIEKNVEKTTFEPENETSKGSDTDEEADELEMEDEEDSSDNVPLILVKKNAQPPAAKSPSLVIDLSSPTVIRSQPTQIVSALSETSFSPVHPPPRSLNFVTSSLYQRQKPQEESNSLKSLIDLTNSAAATTFDPPQDQPLDLAIQPIDLTKRFINDFSASAEPLPLTVTSGSTSTLPMDLSASNRQRLSSSHGMSPLAASSPSVGGPRRIGNIINTLSSQAAAAAAAAAAASQTQQQVALENVSPIFSSRFNSTILASSESFSSSSATNLSQSQPRFQPEAARRPVPVQPATHHLIANVGDNVVPLAMNQHSSSHMTHMENPLRSTAHSVNSSASTAFLLKKQKQRRYRTERPFKCDYCAAGFTLRSNMERHIKQQHPEFWASKSRGRKDRALVSNSLSSRPASISPSLPIPMPSQRILHSVTVPNVAFPSIPPPQNVSEYNPVLAACNLSLSRPPVILNRSPSPGPLPSIANRMSTTPNSNLNKSAVTISDEVKQAISNQIKQRQSVDLVNNGTILSLSTNSTINMVSLVTPATSNSESGNDSVLNSPVEANNNGKANNIRNIWRPAPQMGSEGKSTVEDTDECGADLASVSKLLSTANQQNIQELFRKRRSGDEDEEEENEYENSGNKTEESEEDLPLANLKPKESCEMLPKTPERSKDGRKSAYVNAPNRVACPYCNRQFPWTSSLRRHVLTHTGQKPFKCPKCPLWFTTKSNCDRHLSRKHGGSGGSNLALGITGCGNTSNVICELLENTDGQLLVNSTQNSSLPNNLISQNVDCTARNAPDRPYRCNMCLSSTFSTPGNLQKHMMTKHPQAPNTVSASAGRTKQQKEFSSANNTPVRSDSATSVRIETNGGGGESNSGSEKCWGAESEESGEDQVMNENGQSDGAPLFFCFVCLKSFEDRGHCLEHLKDNHPDEHGFLVKSDNEQLTLVSGIQAKSVESTEREKNSSDAEEP